MLYAMRVHKYEKPHREKNHSPKLKLKLKRENEADEVSKWEKDDTEEEEEQIKIILNKMHFKLLYFWIHFTEQHTAAHDR